MRASLGISVFVSGISNGHASTTGSAISSAQTLSAEASSFAVTSINESLSDCESRKLKLSGETLRYDPGGVLDGELGWMENAPQCGQHDTTNRGVDSHLFNCHPQSAVSSSKSSIVALSSSLSKVDF